MKRIAVRLGVVAGMLLAAGCSQKSFDCTIFRADVSGQTFAVGTLVVRAGNEDSADTKCAQTAATGSQFIGGIGCVCTQEGTQTTTAPDAAHRFGSGR